MGSELLIRIIKFDTNVWLLLPVLRYRNCEGENIVSPVFVAVYGIFYLVYDFLLISIEDEDSRQCLGCQR